MASYITALTLTQPPDCCASELQDLHITIESGGGGHFAVLKTERWTFDLHDLDRLRDRIAELIDAADQATKEGPYEEVPT